VLANNAHDATRQGIFGEDAERAEAQFIIAADYNIAALPATLNFSPRGLQWVISGMH
jgi:hypothetical protein